MNISQVGINLIKSFEGCRLTAYKDVAGVLTIGYGHTSGVRSGQTITQAQADALLVQDLKKFCDTVNANIRVPINQYQFDALVSFAYNVGATAFKTSTLLEMLNKKDYHGASNQFLLWVHAKGKVVQGLVNRRKAEKALFDKAIATPPTTQDYTIRTGENLTVIAKRMNTTVAKIVSLNPSIKNPNVVYAGQKIKVPSK
jgi:lysozyme